MDFFVGTLLVRRRKYPWLVGEKIILLLLSEKHEGIEFKVDHSSPYRWWASQKMCVEWSKNDFKRSVCKERESPRANNKYKCLINVWFETFLSSTVEGIPLVNWPIDVNQSNRDRWGTEIIMFNATFLNVPHPCPRDSSSESNGGLKIVWDNPLNLLNHVQGDKSPVSCLTHRSDI